MLIKEQEVLTFYFQKGWEMKLKPWELVISWRKQHVTIQVDPDTTTFSDVTEKILFQIKKQDEVSRLIYCYFAGIN